MASKRERFLRNAERRTIKAIKAIRVLKKLSNRHLHDFTQEEALKIVWAIEDEVSRTRLAFLGAPPITFNLKESK